MTLVSQLFGNRYRKLFRDSDGEQLEFALLLSHLYLYVMVIQLYSSPLYVRAETEKFQVKVQGFSDLIFVYANQRI